MPKLNDYQDVLKSAPIGRKIIGIYEDSSSPDAIKIFIVTSIGFYIANFDKDY